MTRITMPCACVLALALFTAACGDQKTPAPGPVATPEAISARPEAAPCPDDGPRLPVTQVCAGRVGNYLDPDIGVIAETPADCQWGFTETPMPGGEAIVHRVLTCKGVTTAFEFGAGAHSATLTYTASALFGDQAAGRSPVRIFRSDPADPQKVIKDLLEGVPAAERAKCELRPAKVDGWPKDALVLAYTDAEYAKLPKDEPHSMCGEFGHDEDTASYWRIFGGYAWFFETGQEAPDLDPGSFMLFRKGADGAWMPAD